MLCSPTPTPSSIVNAVGARLWVAVCAAPGEETWIPLKLGTSYTGGSDYQITNLKAHVHAHDSRSFTQVCLICRSTVAGTVGSPRKTLNQLGRTEGDHSLLHNTGQRALGCEWSAGSVSSVDTSYHGVMILQGYFQAGGGGVSCMASASSCGTVAAYSMATSKASRRCAELETHSECTKCSAR